MEHQQPREPEEHQEPTQPTKMCFPQMGLWVVARFFSRHRMLFTSSSEDGVEYFLHPLGSLGPRQVPSWRTSGLHLLSTPRLGCPSRPGLFWGRRGARLGSSCSVNVLEQAPFSQRDVDDVPNKREDTGSNTRWPDPRRNQNLEDIQRTSERAAEDLCSRDMVVAFTVVGTNLS